MTYPQEQIYPRAYIGYLDCCDYKLIFELVIVLVLVSYLLNRDAYKVCQAARRAYIYLGIDKYVR